MGTQQTLLADVDCKKPELKTAGRDFLSLSR
jgi:hypothetical protein